jgi:peptide/nickel transport system permease protein
MATQSLMRRLPPVSVMIAGLVLAVMLCSSSSPR